MAWQVVLVFPLPVARQISFVAPPELARQAIEFCYSALLLLLLLASGALSLLLASAAGAQAANGSITEPKVPHHIKIQLVAARGGCANINSNQPIKRYRPVITQAHCPLPPIVVHYKDLVHVNLKWSMRSTNSS